MKNQELSLTDRRPFRKIFIGKQKDKNKQSFRKLKNEIVKNKPIRNSYLHLPNA